MITYNKDKFMVINRQRFEDLYHKMVEGHIDETVFSDFAKALDKFGMWYRELVGDKKLEHSYYVVNTDEPYAADVWSLISGGTPQESPVYRQDLLNLLAVIHRDGGHHTAKVGVKQSVADGIREVYNDRSSAAL